MSVIPPFLSFQPLNSLSSFTLRAVLSRDAELQENRKVFQQSLHSECEQKQADPTFPFSDGFERRLGLQSSPVPSNYSCKSQWKPSGTSELGNWPKHPHHQDSGERGDQDTQRPLCFIHWQSKLSPSSSCLHFNLLCGSFNVCDCDNSRPSSISDSFYQDPQLTD